MKLLLSVFILSLGLSVEAARTHLGAMNVFDADRGDSLVLSSCRRESTELRTLTLLVGGDGLMLSSLKATVIDFSNRASTVDLAVRPGEYRAGQRVTVDVSSSVGCIRSLLLMGHSIVHRNVRSDTTVRVIGETL